MPLKHLNKMKMMTTLQKTKMISHTRIKRLQKIKRKITKRLPMILMTKHKTTKRPQTKRIMQNLTTRILMHQKVKKLRNLTKQLNNQRTKLHQIKMTHQHQIIPQKLINL